MCVCVCVCVSGCACVSVCQRKTKDRADGMRGKCPFPSMGFEPVPLGYAPIMIRSHHESRHASRQSKQTLQTLTHQLDRETLACITKHSNSYLQDHDCHQASARTSAESEEACQRKTKDGADGMRGKSAHFPRRDSKLYLWDTRPSCFRLHHEQARLA